jgi:tyrosyl-tRNA synthetase
MQAVSIDEQVETLMFGTAYGDPELGRAMTRELKERLTLAQKEGRPLRVYCGYDPSAPDIHLGHTLTMRKLRQFQDFGHHVIFVVGTFTAQIGDTSDKLSGRPRKTPEEVAAAAASYADQAYKILDRERTEVVYNGDWLAEINLAKVVELASHFTVQQFLVRDNYRKRIEANSPVGLHEFMYALLQGWDAVHLRADVQLGATEQLFNIMAGRKLQEAYGQKGCICVSFPILVGLDGKERMSKSKGNYVGIAEPPDEQFGKVMSITDETMMEWVKYLTRWSTEEIKALPAQIASGALHPMDLKKRLAGEIVAMYHGDAAAVAALEHFRTVHQERSLPTEIPTFLVAGPIDIISLLVSSNLAKSKSEARRLVDGGGVRAGDARVSAYDAQISPDTIVQVGKRHFLRLVLEA